MIQVNVCLKCDFKSCNANEKGCAKCKRFCKLSKTNEVVEFNHFVCDKCKEKNDD